MLYAVYYVIYHKRRARYYTYKSDTELEISLVARRDGLQFFFLRPFTVIKFGCIPPGVMFKVPDQ